MKAARMAAIVLAGLVVLYPLSVGPAARYYSTKTPPNAVLQFYQPIFWVLTTFPKTQEPYMFYIRLWGVATSG